MRGPHSDFESRPSVHNRTALSSIQLRSLIDEMMIRLSLRAQLGNQMFQYATVRTFAEQVNQTFVWGYPSEPFLDRLRIALGRKPRHAIQLAQYFKLGSDSQLKQSFLRLLWATTHDWRKTIIKPEYEQTPEGVYREKMIDLPSFRNQHSLELQGWFQSDRYFRENRRRVVEWFSLTTKYLEQWKSVEDSLGIPGRDRCCLHVRRGDYLNSDMGMAAGQEGWALPQFYYQQAWERIPEQTVPLVISDDPDYATEAFRWLPNAVILRGNSPVVDMWMMKNSKYRIIANSSFSWWAAWLAEKGQTFLPEFFLGWARKIWVPVEIFPDGWEPIEVRS